MTLIAVLFNDNDHNGRTTGDSTWYASCGIPYVDGMSLSQLQEEAVMELLGGRDMKGVKEEFNMLKDEGELVSSYEVTGAWIVEEKIYKAITNVSCDWGNDSAEYASNATMKEQIANVAEFVIE